MANLLGLRAQGALVRSCFQSVELVDVPSKFFFNLEEKSGQRKLTHVLGSADRTILTDFPAIRERAVGFYKEL